MNLGTVPVKVTGLKVKMTVLVKLLKVKVTVPVKLQVKVTVPVMVTLKVKVTLTVKATVQEVKAVNVSSEDEELELTEARVVKPVKEAEEGKKVLELP